MSDAVLTLDGITKTFVENGASTPALANASLEISAKEIVCLMGPSGCGKSTLLRIVAGLEHADAGKVQGADGKDGAGPVAMVFQDHALFPWLTVEENIVYGLKLAAQKVPEDEIRQRADKLLTLTRLSAFAQSLPHQLSGGMKQRVSVARALAVKPPVILMDEPFSALDPFTRRELEDAILDIRRDLETTILVVSHDPEGSVYIADRIVILSERPGTVAEIIPVDLPYPRDPADPAFIRLREQVTRKVLGKSG
jgi:NitT/TauT family transport system ATP-binding protein